MILGKPKVSLIFAHLKHAVRQLLLRAFALKQLLPQTPHFFYFYLMNLPTTIDEVLLELDQIIETALKENNSAALFAFVYRRTTAEIKKGIEAGIFDDNQRMHDFDVRFANLYIEAWRAYREGQTLSSSWKVAFDASKDKLCCLQHIILGMNAHINLDLGNAAAITMHKKDLLELKKDFFLVNQILFSLTDEMQKGLGQVSPLLFLADWMGKRNDEWLINFGIEKARSFSWETANLIWSEQDANSGRHLKLTDEAVAALGQLMRRPKNLFLRFLLRIIYFFEEKNISKLVNVLRRN